jgi:tripartite-type tricarboxylate transporter receptor subunit TctC
MTLSVVSNNVVIFPSVYKTLPFELPADITPIAIVGFTPIVLVVNAKVPAKDSKELIALLKSQPGKSTTARAATGPSCTLPPRSFSTKPASRRRMYRTRASVR